MWHPSRRAKLAVLWTVTGCLLALPLFFPRIAADVNRPLQWATLFAVLLVLWVFIRDRNAEKKAAAQPPGGYVVLEGHRFPLDGLRLIEGGIELVFTVYGPMPELNGDLTVFGADGRGCWQCPDRHVSDTEAGHARRVTHRMHMAKVEAG